ncbi:MAG: hypothetical protein J7L16_06930 [Deltaproteobacteria bacterium]|nr:hypothetical protein [Deltaproteobacteria bacterium]
MKESRKDCFGRLNKVFPEGKNKLREVPPGCFDCIDRKECLRTALNTEEGLEFKSGLIERNRGLGFMDHLKRWSDKKQISMLLKQKKRNRK